MRYSEHATSKLKEFVSSVVVKAHLTAEVIQYNTTFTVRREMEK